MSDSKTDFLKALLALDAYNRHGDKGLRNISDAEGFQLSSKIGLIEFKQSSDRLENVEAALQGSQDSGFSASHYTLGDGSTAIAYRGTDFNFSSNDGIFEFLRDFAKGWLPSFTAIDSETIDISDFEGDEINLQPYYAQKFYELISENKIFPTNAEGEQPTNITLVGHSLGGSLAGYIGSLTGNETTIFNEIPYIGLP